MFSVPLNSSLNCQSYFQSQAATLPKFLVYYAISECMRDLEGLGSSGGYGVDLFITSVANEYYSSASQIMVMYDESWDITEMLIKLESQSRKSFVTYFLPKNHSLAHENSKPPDHITHKLLPIATAFIVFVKDEDAFTNMLVTLSEYPWWNKRARFLILVKDKALEPTKGILTLLESEKIFNVAVVTEFAIKDNSTGFFIGNVTYEGDNSTTGSGMELQVVALDPYPLPGHSKQSFVARWKNTEYSAFIRPIFQDKIDNLRGNKLIACVFEFPPLVIKEEISPGNFNYYGQEVKIFQEFAAILNFTYKFYEPPAGERWGENLGDNNWTGLVGETQKNADFGFASVFLLDNRELAVDVSNPYDQDQGCFAVPRPENLQNWTGLILPFSWQMWACILALALVAGPIFSGITRPLNIDKSITVGRGIFYALGSLVSAQKAPQAKSHALRTFIVVWLIFCWLSFILYRVALIVSLTTGPSSSRIDTIRQLVRAGIEWGGFKEVLNTFTKIANITEPEKEVGLFSRRVKETDEERQDRKLFERFEELTNITEALDRVAEKGDFAVLDSSKFLQYAAKGRYFDGYSSAIHITRECPTRYNVGFIMPIGSPFLDKINELISQLQSAGLIDKWFRDILHQAALKIPNKDKRKGRERALSLDNMKLCYIIFFFGNFCAFVSFCVENFCLYYKNKKMILRRKISMISSGITPSFLITEAENLKGAFTRKRKDSVGSIDRIVRLHPPQDPDAIEEDLEE